MHPVPSWPPDVGPHLSPLPSLQGAPPGLGAALLPWLIQSKSGGTTRPTVRSPSCFCLKIEELKHKQREMVWKKNQSARNNGYSGPGPGQHRENCFAETQLRASWPLAQAPSCLQVRDYVEKRRRPNPGCEWATWHFPEAPSPTRHQTLAHPWPEAPPIPAAGPPRATSPAPV